MPGPISGSRKLAMNRPGLDQALPSLISWFDSRCSKCGRDCSCTRVVVPTFLMNLKGSANSFNSGLGRGEGGDQPLPPRFPRRAFSRFLSCPMARCTSLSCCRPQTACGSTPRTSQGAVVSNRRSPRSTVHEDQFEPKLLQCPFIPCLGIPNR